jgi:hypothetical protein
LSARGDILEYANDRRKYNHIHWPSISHSADLHDKVTFRFLKILSLTKIATIDGFGYQKIIVVSII